MQVRASAAARLEGPVHEVAVSVLLYVAITCNMTSAAGAQLVTCIHHKQPGKTPQDDPLQLTLMHNIYLVSSDIMHKSNRNDDIQSMQLRLMVNQSCSSV
jgi:hypothetical protein